MFWQVIDAESSRAIALPETDKNVNGLARGIGCGHEGLSVEIRAGAIEHENPFVAGRKEARVGEEGVARCLDLEVVADQSVPHVPRVNIAPIAACLAHLGVGLMEIDECRGSECGAVDVVKRRFPLATVNSGVGRIPLAQNQLGAVIPVRVEQATK